MARSRKKRATVKCKPYGRSKTVGFAAPFWETGGANRLPACGTQASRECEVGGDPGDPQEEGRAVQQGEEVSVALEVDEAEGNESEVEEDEGKEQSKPFRPAPAPHPEQRDGHSDECRVEQPLVARAGAIGHTHNAIDAPGEVRFVRHTANEYSGS